MTELSRIGGLWIEGPLSFLEQLCLVSFRDAGHEAILFTYGDVPNIPDGIERRDAAKVLPLGDGLKHERSGSPAPHADRFRYHMLRTHEDMIWADTDAYCVKPFTTETGHFFGWESERHVNNGVLGLPPASPTLSALIDFTSDPTAIPPWFTEGEIRELEAAKAAGEPLHAGQMSWGVWGPQALTHFLKETGEIEHALPRHALYPFTFKDRRLMLKRGIAIEDYVKDDTYSIHFYGRRMRARIAEKEGGVPKRYSLIGKLLAKHEVDPLCAPLQLPEGQLSDTAEDEGTYHRPLDPGSWNLTDLADDLGLEKGAAKHRYTELYEMLFRPMRETNCNLWAIGVGSGEDLPEMRLWLDYFPFAQVTGLGTGTTPRLKHRRFRYIQTVPGGQKGYAALVREGSAPHIIIDAGTHASKDQQDALLALFPALAPGGLYLIEGLRWQPSEREADTPGITKTADLLQGFLRHRTFRHSEPETEVAFNALLPQISGCFVFQAQFDKRRKDQMAVIHKL